MSFRAPKIAGGPYVMGVLNVTPDSFSDGGRWSDRAAAVEHAIKMLADGADVIDVGGESTRPGAMAVEAEEEIARTVPVIEAIARRADTAISIDTMKPAVARAAFAAGARMWNDVTALQFAPDSLGVAATLGGEVVLMHMQGEPRTMQDKPRYGDVVAEVIAFLEARAGAAAAAGIPRARIWVDPGIGFGKTLEHNLALMRALARIRAETGCRLLFGASRKSFIARIDRGAMADQRLGGSLAAALLAAQSGADMIRVHDVRETVQALKLWSAVRAG
jgi:dihydropteroate synthase